MNGGGSLLAIEERKQEAGRLLAGMKRRAMRSPYWYDGRTQPPSPDLYRKTRQILDPTMNLTVAVILDHGMHASGWFRNSDYDRCLHLSLSCPGKVLPVVIREDRPGKPVGAGFLPIPSAEVDLWARLCFGDDERWLWHESGQYMRHVVHLRLFLDQNNQPIMPEGDVYNLKPWKDGTSPEKIFRI